MRKLTILEHLSLDGIVQSPGSPDEDRDGGFAFGGWSFPHADPVAHALIADRHSKPFDLLLGRRTYDIWSAYWPTAPASPFKESFNAATKHVATHRPESLHWGPAHALGPDIAKSVRELKQTDGPDLILWGSSTLTPVLIGHELADEIELLIYPVLIGTGKRFFSDVVAPRELKLIRSGPVATGIIMSVYQPAGALRTGSFTADDHDE